MLYLLHSEFRVRLLFVSFLPTRLIHPACPRAHPLTPTELESHSSSPSQLAVSPHIFDHHALQSPVCTERFPSLTALHWHNAMDYIYEQRMKSDSLLVRHWKDLKSKREQVVPVQGYGRQKRKRGEQGSSSGVWHGIHDDVKQHL